MCRQDRGDASDGTQARQTSDEQKSGDKVVEIYEVQRRLTLFHTKWQAPFLPHDGVLRWRWVDKSYKKHQWMKDPLETCSQAGVPPLKFPGEWEFNDSGVWSIDTGVADCDADGWQYAVDFYGGQYGLESWWLGTEPSLCSCRRRLWRCTLKDTSRGESGAAGAENSNAPMSTEPSPEVSPTTLVPDEEPKVDMTTILDINVPGLDVGKEAEIFLADDWSCGNLILDFFMLQGATEIQPAPPTLPLAGNLQSSGTLTRSTERQVSARLIVPPAPMAPKTTRATLTYRITARQTDSKVDSLIVRADVVVHDTPYCDVFYVHEILCFTRSDDGTHVKKSFGVVFNKRVFVQSIIASSSEKAQQQAREPLQQFLLRRGMPQSGESGSPGSKVASTASENFFGKVPSSKMGNLDTEPMPSLLARTHQSKKCGSPTRSRESGKIILKVWELERRFTLFHTTWQAPFLPHDGETKWRWVDQEFRKHKWAVGSCDVSAKSSTPAIEFPKHLKAATSGWTLPKLPANRQVDADGWQYAVDFYTSDDQWFSSKTWFHCRRRLWQIELTDSTVAFARSLPQPEKSATDSSASRCLSLKHFAVLASVFASLSCLRSLLQWAVADQ